MAKQAIPTFNQDVDAECNYCKEVPSTSLHVKWTCSYFESTRREVDAELAALPRKYFLECVRCGIAPAMKAQGNLAYWGMEVD